MTKTDRLQIRVSTEFKERLQALADAEHRSISNLVEHILEEAMRDKYKSSNDDCKR